MTGVTTHGGNVVSDTDSTDDLGTTGVRWANTWTDAINGVTSPTAQYTSAEETKLAGIEASADVTDATNVLAALVGQEAVATGFTGTLDGVLGGGTPAAATVTTLTASGVTTVQAGTALLPSIVPTGDTNTGVWFPAADTVAASTAGTERMRIDTSGNVGIGTTSPSTYADSFAPVLVVGTGNNFATVQGRTDGPSAAGNGVNFGASYSTNPINSCRIFMAPQGGTGQSGLMVFETKALNDSISQPLERMRINAAGNVGIGTTAPVTPLDVNGITRTVSAYSLSYAGVTGATSAFGAGTISADSNWGMYFKSTTGAASAEFAFVNAAGSERMRIDTSGNVGIGTDSPSEKLSVHSAIGIRGSNFAGLSYFGSSVNLTGVYTGLDSGGGYAINVRDAGYQAFSTSNTERMRIDSSGNVGIGTSTLNGTLLVISQNGNAAPSSSGNMDTGSFLGTVGTGSPALNIGHDADGTWYNSAYFNNAGVARIHRWLTGGTERMRITSAGNVGIGTAAPSEKLHVDGNVTITGTITAPDILKANLDDTLSGGFQYTADADGAISTGTYTPAYAGGNVKTITGTGSFTIAPQSGNGVIVVQYTVTSGTPTVTTSGYDKVTGDAIGTVTGNDFLFQSTVVGTFSHLHVTDVS
jgi:hypothetical protein